MKYTITGGAGNISKPLSLALLEAGHDVTVIGRSSVHLQPLVEAGATAAVGSVEDVDFLKEAFAGADAAYIMVPPNFTATQWLAHIDLIGKNYAAAIQSSTVRYIVNLSSIGAHLPEGAGPISGLHRVEETLNALAGINVLHLRAAYFYPNFFSTMS